MKIKVCSKNNIGKILRHAHIVQGKLNFISSKITNIFQKLAVEMEIGLPANPLKISWLSGKPESFAPPSGSNSNSIFSQGGDLGFSVSW